MNSNFGWHVLALLVVCIWGSTFVASKILLVAGLTPAQIMTVRFLIAWLLMLPWCHKRLITNLRDELYFMALGLSGGSLYFLAENTAVQLASATSTVALLVCTTPIITALINRMVYHSEHLSSRFMVGSLVALIGVSLVVFNGVFVLDDDPLVIILSIAASVTWAIYCLIIRKLDKRYSSAVITRKVFFWGVITMLPVVFFEDLDYRILLNPTVISTACFLAVIASFGCFLAWNIVLRRLGVVVTGNYLYFNPVTSLITAYLVLNEHITWLAIVGCVLTIAGVYLCNRKKSAKRKLKEND